MLPRSVESGYKRFYFPSGEPTHLDLRNHLLALRSAERDITGDRIHLFTRAQKLELRNIYDDKTFLLIKSLELRRKGDDCIQLNVTGQYDSDFPYSRNKFSVKFATPNLAVIYFKGNLSDLRNYYPGGNVNQLIGTPDAYLDEESFRDYLIRTIFETKELNHATEQEVSIAQRLYFETRLGERILQLKRYHHLGSQIKITLLKDQSEPLIEIRYFPPGRPQSWQCYLHQPQRGDVLAKLLEESGDL